MIPMPYMRPQAAATPTPITPQPGLSAIVTALERAYGAFDDGRIEAAVSSFTTAGAAAGRNKDTLQQAFAEFRKIHPDATFGFYEPTALIYLTMGVKERDVRPSVITLFHNQLSDKATGKLDPSPKLMEYSITSNGATTIQKYLMQMTNGQLIIGAVI